LILVEQVLASSTLVKRTQVHISEDLYILYSRGGIIEGLENSISIKAFAFKAKKSTSSLLYKLGFKGGIFSILLSLVYKRALNIDLESSFSKKEFQ
jgi:hypothetical protein